MAEVTAKLVQELREKTSAGMMDCKKALVEKNGDIEAAADTQIGHGGKRLPLTSSSRRPWRARLHAPDKPCGGGVSRSC